MKKNILLLIIICLLSLSFTTGCDKDALDKSNITVSVYPIEYLITRLYNLDQNNYTLASIYPNGTNINEYELTDKQLTDYSKSTTLFVYN